MLYFVTLMVIIPLLNDGSMATFAQSTLWRYGEDASSLDRIKYLIWTLALLMTPLAMGFEALMFVHAALNDSVFGIDQNLRKTFRTAMFTGTGALLFITATEFMEQVLGQGLIGGCRSWCSVPWPSGTRSHGHRWHVKSVDSSQLHARGNRLP